ncbi:MAG: S26 family signal peptidase [Planctomycetota bacterium]
MTRVLGVMAIVAAGCFSCHHSEPSPQFRVTGPSMGDALPGPHVRHRCPLCQFVTRCDPLPGTGELTCQNCGTTAPLSEHHLNSRHPGTPVRLQRPHEIRRWQLVAFPHQNRWLVKRIVGLPGEQIALHEGEVWVHGRRVVKSAEDFRRVAVLVHDDRFRTDQTRRWAGSNAHWQAIPGGYRWVGQELPASEPLVYAHVEPALVAAAVHQVYDSYGYNQGLSRKLHVVEDLALCGQVTLTGDVRLTLIARNGTDVTWESPRDTVRFGAQTAPLAPGKATRFWFGTWDGATHLTIGSEELDSVETGVGDPAGPAFQFEAEGSGTVELRDLQLYRDLYHLAGPAGTWRLEDDQCLLLGDNVPRSTDSRTDVIGPIAVSVLRAIALDDTAGR